MSRTLELLPDSKARPLVLAALAAYPVASRQVKFYLLKVRHMALSVVHTYVLPSYGESMPISPRSLLCPDIFSYLTAGL